MSNFDNIFEHEILEMIEQALINNDIQKIKEVCKLYQLKYFEEFLSYHPCFKTLLKNS